MSDALPFDLGSANLEDDPAFLLEYQDMLREDLCLFAKDVLGLEIGPHIVAWGDLVDQEARLAVNAARDHSKSTFFSYAYPIWRIWGEPGCEVYIFSKTLEQAAEFLDIILYGRNNLKGIVDIPGLDHLMPSRDAMKVDPSLRLNKADVKFTNGSRIRVAGYGKAMRGRHPKYVVLDDPLNDEDMWSETTRMKNIEYFKSAITNMVMPEGQLIVVGTPYHASDLYGFLRKNPVYTFIRFPGIIKDRKTGEERALFPWRWSLEKLRSKKKEIGSVSFAREILCQPISDDLSIFPEYLFPPCYAEHLTMRMPLEQIQANGWVCYMGVDIARSSSVGADYFVIFVIARSNTGEHIIMDIRRSRGLPFQQQLQEIEIAAALYDPSIILIESNAMQQIYTDEMRRLTDLPVKPFLTLATNKYPLDRGVPGLRILLEGQKVVIPKGDEISLKLSGIWEDECTQFGFIDGKLQGIGEHDDTVMSWWFAVEAAKMGGFSFSFGDEDADEDDPFGDGEGGEDWKDVFLGDDAEKEAEGFTL